MCSDCVLHHKLSAQKKVRNTVPFLSSSVGGEALRATARPVTRYLLGRVVKHSFASARLLVMDNAIPLIF